MYKIVYPENGQQVVSMEFHESWEATAYWRNKHGAWWVDIEPQGPSDKKAFMHIITGAIVVVREMEEAA